MMQGIDWNSIWMQDEFILAAGLVASGLLTVVLLVMVLRRRLQKPPVVEPLPPDERFIDVTQLEALGPRDDWPRAEIYGVPVRIAIVILAPVGRDGVQPQEDQLAGILEQLVPGFLPVIVQDQPRIKAWPGQLSTQGFTHAFFNNVPLPGDRGKGTPWCALAGRFSTAGQSYMAGLVCTAGQSNGLGQYAIQHEGQWNDILRVRKLSSDDS